MHPSVETCPGQSQVTKSNFFARTVNVFKVVLPSILVKSTIIDV